MVSGVRVRHHGTFKCGSARRKISLASVHNPHPAHGDQRVEDLWQAFLDEAPRLGEAALQRYSVRTLEIGHSHILLNVVSIFTQDRARFDKRLFYCNFSPTCIRAQAVSFVPVESFSVEDTLSAIAKIQRFAGALQ